MVIYLDKLEFVEQDYLYNGKLQNFLQLFLKFIDIFSYQKYNISYKSYISYFKNEVFI